MKTLLLLALAASQAFGACAATWANGYTKCVEITILHAQVANTDQTDFTTTICLNGSGCGTSFSVPDLRVTGSGGSVTSASCFDCIWTSDNAGTTLLSWAKNVYTGSTGEAVFKVKKTVLTATDVKVYLFFGNASTTTFQGGSVGSAYAAHFIAGYGFGDGATLALNDLSSNGLTLTNHSATAAAGKIGGGIVTTLANYATNASSVTGLTDSFTISAWVKTSAATQQIIVNISTDNGAGQEYIQLTATAENAQVGDAGGGSGRATGTTNVADGTFHYISGTIDTSFRIYVDGVVQTTQVATKGFAADGIWIGQYHNGSFGFVGTIDEVEVWGGLGGARSADWIKTTFNNQSSPSTFYSAAAAVGQGGGVAHKVRAII